MLNVEFLECGGLPPLSEHLCRSINKAAASCRTPQIQQSTFNIAVLFLLLFLAFPLAADEVQVDKRTLSLDDTLTVTVTLSDAFAALDNFQLPLQNLVVDGSPSVSSEFSWINGQSTRRKVFRYVVHPRGPGPALVGPVVLRGAEGQVETLAPISIQVLPDRTAGSNDPVTILHELLATGRDPIFVVAEADKSSVLAGEEVIVTWTIYNATSVQQHWISEMPKLGDFWVEELDIRGEGPQQIIVGGASMQKLVIRRVALFPLRSGTLTVDSLAVEAQVMKRIDIGNPFGLFEGSVTSVNRRSSPLSIDVRPVPPGPPVAAVGEVAMECGMPVQKNGGPVEVVAVMRGAANLRAAPPPAFAQPVDGSLQVADIGVTVQRRPMAVMTRQWRYLLFPSHSGMFVIPPLTATILTTAGVRREVRCEQRALVVEAADATGGPVHPSSVSTDRRIESARRTLPLAGLLALLLLAVAIVWPRLARAARLRREVAALVRAMPGETRIAVDGWLTARGADPALLIRETSERGDAYRALRSLTDAAEHDRLIADPADLRARIRDVVNSL